MKDDLEVTLMFVAGSLCTLGVVWCFRGHPWGGVMLASIGSSIGLVLGAFIRRRRDSARAAREEERAVALIPAGTTVTDCEVIRYGPPPDPIIAAADAVAYELTLGIANVGDARNATKAIERYLAAKAAAGLPREVRHDGREGGAPGGVYWQDENGEGERRRIRRELDDIMPRVAQEIAEGFQRELISEDGGLREETDSEFRSRIRRALEDGEGGAG